MDSRTNDTEPYFTGRFSAKYYLIKQWYAVAGVSNNGTLNIYVNGVLDNGTESGINPGTVINNNVNN
jgi:hypothetical protein